MAFTARQPMGELGSPRLQTLFSAKNRQNAFVPAPDFSASVKQTLSTPRKRRAPSVFEDEDSENVNPSTFNSPTKKAKTCDGPSKPANFSLFTSPTKPSPPAAMATASAPSVRRALASPKSLTSNSTPIGLSRGSPKHKRVGLLSKRRASSSPFRRIDPPSFSHSSPSLPFSIDAALKGTIPDYTPQPAVVTPAPVTPAPVSALEESMPKSWFFEIHEDTPEQEAANMMEHSAAVLDISSDDDSETKRRTEELERGKENIPPPDFVPFQPTALAQLYAEAMETNEPVKSEHVKLPRLRKQLPQDAMDEDRKPLSDLPAADFYGEGLDATSYVTVDAGIERPSGLSNEFDFNEPAPQKPSAEEKTVVEENISAEDHAIVEEQASVDDYTSLEEKTVTPAVEQEPIQIYVDVTAQCEPAAVSDAQDLPCSTTP